MENICLYCHEPVTRERQGGKDQLLFCNRSHAASYNNAKKPKRAKTPEATCPTCEGSKRKDSRLCTNCRKAEQEAELTKITLQDLREQYSTAQFHAKVRRLSRTAFRGPAVCAVCEYDFHVDVCHIVAVADFPLTATLAEVNHPNNLVALCPNHHWEFDNDMLVPEAGLEPAPSDL